jgi:hypothetical protein
MWNLDLVEKEKAVIHRVISKLGTNVSNMDVLQWLVGLQVSDLNAEGSWAVRLATHHELGHYDRVVCSATERTNPPFACCKVRRVNGKGLVV